MDSESEKLPVDVLKKLSEAIALFPNVKPRKGYQRLKGVFDRLIDKQLESPTTLASEIEMEVESEPLTLAYVEDHLFRMNEYDTPHVTPEGAQTLIRLYEAGFFEMQSGRSIDEPSALKEYSQSRTVLEEEAARLAAERRSKREDREAALANPAQLNEDDFTWSLLNAVFYEHLGSGPGAMDIGGIRVRKDVIRYSSNSGKSRDYEVTFTWHGKEGNIRELKKPSRYRNNRRNDPERNWGLPE